MIPDPEKLAQAARCLKALAHPVRLGILCALRDGPKSVLALENTLGISQSGVSQHLANMREREILLAQRQGNQVFYSARDPRMFQLLDLLQALYCKDLSEDMIP